MMAAGFLPNMILKLFYETPTVENRWNENETLSKLTTMSLQYMLWPLKSVWYIMNTKNNPIWLICVEY